MIPAQTSAPFQSASLYVGDLHFEVSEGRLFELFNRVGPVASIRVCRDAVTRRSLGYAYVNFHNVQDAERALDTMNFNDINGRPCRIMWSQRDPSLRKSGVGNVFVKNLAPTVDNKGLFDTFSVFGNILSCKVATDSNGASKGYGYVHYETAEAAQDSIQKFNGNFIDDHEVYVGPFVRRQERPRQWTNLYVKQFPVFWDEAKLSELFSIFGPISSIVILRDNEEKSKGFGFIDFADHESAENALKNLSNKEFENGDGTHFILYVNRAQKKVERTRDIKNRLDAAKSELVSKYQGMNLYVKNLDDSISDEFFKDLFAKFGAITSARIMRDPVDNTSKGFGFVCYGSPEEAARALNELNGKILNSKPIYVAQHQRKEQRLAALAASYAPRNMRFPNNPAGMPVPYMHPMFVPQPGQQPNFPPQRAFPFPGQQPPNFPPRGAPRNMPFPGRGVPPSGFFPMSGYGNVPPQMVGGPNQPGNFNKRMMPNGQPVQMGMMQQGGPRRSQQGGRGVGGRNMMPSPMQMGPGRGVKFNNNVRNQGPGMISVGQHQQQAMPLASSSLTATSDQPLDDQALAQADPQMQKNMIGERLYPLIYIHKPNLAGKITGMLLEMDNAELLNLIESPDALMSKIDEAIQVLKAHQPIEDE